MNNLIVAISQRFIAVILAVTLVFFLLRLLPGDAVEAQLVAVGASEAEIAQQRQQLGLDAPLPTQYAGYLGALLRGDLGHSLARGVPVSTLISDAVYSTLPLAGLGWVGAVILGVFLGLLSSVSIGFGVSAVAQTLMTMALSVPIYWTGTLAIFIFSAQLGWLPSTSSSTATGLLAIRHLILPVGVLAFHTSGAVARVVQTTVVTLSQTDFARTAHAKGLSERVVLWRHVLRAGWIPVITVMALQAGFLIGGTIITETLFVRPGLGRVLVDAVMRRDYPVVQAVALIAVIAYASIGLCVDLLYPLLDPRIRA